MRLNYYIFVVDRYVHGGSIPVDDRTLRRTLIDFYSEMIELYKL